MVLDQSRNQSGSRCLFSRGSGSCPKSLAGSEQRLLPPPTPLCPAHFTLQNSFVSFWYRCPSASYILYISLKCCLNQTKMSPKVAHCVYITANLTVAPSTCQSDVNGCLKHYSLKLWATDQSCHRWQVGSENVFFCWLLMDCLALLTNLK